MKIAIIGCGLIGKKRAEAIKIQAQDKIVGCYDVNNQAAIEFSKKYQCKSYESAEELLKQSEAEAIVVSVVNKFAKPFILQAIHLNRHVLAEKPLGRNLQESAEILRFLSTRQNQDGLFLAVKTGFNLRFHPALQKAKSLLSENKLGRLYFIRAQYGHGGRPGMENEWRASKDLCGGGELLDQGVHLVDLCRWFAGDIASVSSILRTNFWKMEVEDTAFVQMRTTQDVDIQFQVGWTLWKNTFAFEIFGEVGYIRIQGLGGSYGEETLEVGIRNPQGGVPSIQKEVFGNSESCWLSEWDEYKEAIRSLRQPHASARDGHEANRVIEAIYQSAHLNCPIELSAND
jgi:predicted dehydrogenase